MTKSSKDCFQVSYPSDFEIAIIEGARVPFKMRVQRQKTTLKSNMQNCEDGIKQFQRNDEFGIFKTISDTLTAWAVRGSGNRIAMWISETLAVDLGLPVSNHPPSSVLTQVLFLGEYFPVFVLTLCKSKTTISSEMKYTADSPYETVQERPTEVETFTALVTKRLMSSLLRFCYCDFIILSCTLTYDTFCTNPDQLTKEIKLKLERVRQFYGGPGYLDSKAYDAIKSAVEVTMGMSHWPDILSEPQTNTPVIVDSEWQKMISRYIETLYKEKRVVFSEKESFKEKVALLEAARRLSFRDDVHVAHCDRELEKCFKDIAIRTEEETGTRINLRMCFLPDTKKAKLTVVVVGGKIKCPACPVQSPEHSLEPMIRCQENLIKEAVIKAYAKEISVHSHSRKKMKVSMKF